MKYYPTLLPYVNIEKLKSKNIKSKVSSTTMLYSPEGIFQIRNGQLYQVHFKDALENTKCKIKGVEYIRDDSEIIWTPSSKLPYNFERRDITETCFERGSVKFYVLKNNEQKMTHCYFQIKDPNILDIEKDIGEMMSLACAKS